MHEVHVRQRPIRALHDVAGEDAAARYDERVRRVRPLMQGRTLWNINSTAEGGGVAELLRSCLGYLRDGGIDVRWLVVEGDDPFFRVTKRIHNRLHGDLGDGGRLGPAERQHYDEITTRNLADVQARVRPEDVVVVHDPQPLGLIRHLSTRGIRVIWTCHVGVDTPNDIVRSAWDFLRVDVLAASVCTFTRRPYVWDGLDDGRVVLIPPCIDPLSAKNLDLTPDVAAAIVGAAGLIEGTSDARPTFVRSNGVEATIVHKAQLTEDAPVPADVPVVAQVSRWDALKDPAGVMRGFVDHPDLGEAHLVLAGPTPYSVADDPEARSVLGDVIERRRGLRGADRERVHVANLPTDDVEENAIIVNALQRRADVVVQKSLAEGFGLTVAEAMWKERPIVAGGVGGIQDQIENGVSGVLIDPRDTDAFGDAVHALLDDPDRRRRLGVAAKSRVRERYLPLEYLGTYLDVVATLTERV
jgi:trehalose synthase